MADYLDHKKIASTLLEQQGIITGLRAQLAETADVLRAVGKAAIVVHPALNTPYPDEPRWTPWTRWLEKPARRAYNLGVLLRAQQRAAGVPHRLSDAATRLYDAARQQADIQPGHTVGCGWHTTSGAYCSCGVWTAACAGVDATLDALDVDQDGAIPGRDS